jgi:hypothetical protein
MLVVMNLTLLVLLVLGAGFYFAERMMVGFDNTIEVRHPNPPTDCFSDPQTHCPEY